MRRGVETAVLAAAAVGVLSVLPVSQGAFPTVEVARPGDSASDTPPQELARRRLPEMPQPRAVSGPVASSDTSAFTVDESLRVARAMAGSRALHRAPSGTRQWAAAHLAPIALVETGRDVTPDTVADLARELGVWGDDGFDTSRHRDLAARSRGWYRPLFAAAGLDVPDTITRAHVVAVFEAYELDVPDALGREHLQALRRSVREDLDEIRAVSGSDADPSDQDGLPEVLTALGLDYGNVVDAVDVVRARGRASDLLLAAKRQAEQAVAAAAPPPAASAPPPAPDPASPWTTVAGSMEHRSLDLPGPVRAEVVRWRLDDPSLRLRADYALNPAGRVAVDEVGRRPGVAMAVNGGFWVGTNDPDGLLVRDGNPLSDTTATANGSRNVRGAIGLRGQQAVVGIPSWNLHLTAGDRRVGVRGLNRDRFRGDDVIVFTPGVHSRTPFDAPGTYLRVPLVTDLDVNGSYTVPVLGRASSGPVSIGGDTMVIYLGPGVDLPANVSELTIHSSVREPWQGLDQALAAGPLLLQGGTPTGAGQWRAEGFDAAHTDSRHPRSAIGVTPDGHAVVVAINGRRPGHSVGMTVAETIGFLQGLGVTDAVMLDGGGSSQLAVGGRIINQPCCDDRLRAVSTVLVVERR